MKSSPIQKSPKQETSQKPKIDKQKIAELAKINLQLMRNNNKRYFMS